jgi:hypothetical protein
VSNQTDDLTTHNHRTLEQAKILRRQHNDDRNNDRENNRPLHFVASSLRHLASPLSLPPSSRQQTPCTASPRVSSVLRLYNVRGQEREGPESKRFRSIRTRQAWRAVSNAAMATTPTANR